MKGRNYMNIEKYAIFLKTYWNIHLLKIKNIIKVAIIVIIQVDIKWIYATHSICNLKYSIPKKITTIFHNTSNYDYHVIIKELAEEFEENLLVLEKILENT